jgi:hypothetical protein
MASKRQWKGVGELSRHYWNHIKHHAFERDVDFDISLDEAWSLFLEQDRQCAISGIKIEFGRHRPIGTVTRKWPRLGTASLDRKDSDGPYNIGNVQWVHKEINRMKGTLSDSAFVEICCLVSRRNQHQPHPLEAGL